MMHNNVIKSVLISLLLSARAISDIAHASKANIRATTGTTTTTASTALKSIPHGGGEQKQLEKKAKLSSLELAVAGAVATMIGDTAMHPVDCLKTLQQSNEGAGLNMIAAGRKIYKTSGIGGFYSGLGTYVISDGGAGAIKFATYEALKQWVADKVPEEYVGAAIFGCAAMAFVASSVVLVPGELIKQRLQMGQYSTIGSAVQSIWQTEGAKGFYAGYTGVCLRDIPYTMFELGLYDNFKSLYLKIKNRDTQPGENIKITQMDEIIAAAITGGITGYLSNPLDMIKTKLMVDGQLYSGFFDCVRKTVQTGGVSSLFNGGAARVAWLMPFTAIYLPIYDIFKRRLEARKSSSPIVQASSERSINVKGGAQVQPHYDILKMLSPKQKRAFISF